MILDEAFNEKKLKNKKYSKKSLSVWILHPIILTLIAIHLTYKRSCTQFIKYIFMLLHIYTIHYIRIYIYIALPFSNFIPQFKKKLTLIFLSLILKWLPINDLTLTTAFRFG